MTGIYPDVVDLTGGNLVLVIVVALIALGALGMAVMFRAEVLSAPEGTDNMKNIALAVQEGADAYLQRQFRTLAIFAGLAFFALLALPADDTTVRIFRSVFFLVGAGFSASVGYLGMSLAVRANLRVATAANTVGREPAMTIGLRTGAMVGMLTVGLGLLGASIVVLAFGSAAESTPRLLTSAPTWSARSSRTSQKTTRATPRPSPTTSATTWATAPAWPPTCSSRTPSPWSRR
jgi:K(+)-stimulated pyrophosphate-energized sodium pump